MLYTVVGIGTVLLLRLLRRRWQEGDLASGEEDVSAAPYGPVSER